MRTGRRGLTMLELLIAMFIFGVGIVGILSAVPSGVKSAELVILRDAGIHLAESKFAEFRRDRIDAGVDLINGSTYLPSGGGYVDGKQEPPNSSGDEWRDFAHAKGQPYYYFDDIARYEWRVKVTGVDKGTGGVPIAPANYYQPVTLAVGGASPIKVYKVAVSVRQRGKPEDVTFTQYLFSYGR